MFVFQLNGAIRRNKPSGSLPAVWGEIWGFPRCTWMQRRSFSLKCSCGDRSVFVTGPWFVDPSLRASFFLKVSWTLCRLSVKLHLKVMLAACNVFMANISCVQLISSTNLPLHSSRLQDSQQDQRGRALNALPRFSVCVCRHNKSN